MRVSTEIGYFVAKAWITEGIRPGVVACSHHMGRWRLDGGPRGVGGMMATVGLRHSPDGSAVSRRAGVGPYQSADPDYPRQCLSELTVTEDIAVGGLDRVPVAGLNLFRALRAIWAGGHLPPEGAARDLLAHVAGRP